MLWGVSGSWFNGCHCCGKVRLLCSMQQSYAGIHKTHPLFSPQFLRIAVRFRFLLPGVVIRQNLFRLTSPAPTCTAIRFLCPHNSAKHALSHRTTMLRATSNRQFNSSFGGNPSFISWSHCLSKSSLSCPLAILKERYAQESSPSYISTESTFHRKTHL